MLRNNNMLRMVGLFSAMLLVLIGQLPLVVPAQTRSQTAGQQVLATGQEPTGPGGTAKAAPLTGGQQSYSAHFDTDLFIQDPIQLRGVAAGMTINFVRPRDWTVQSGTEVRFQLSHSDALLADLSYLNVIVNSTTLKTISLDKSNILTTVISVPIPPELLKDYNQLQFSVAQHYTRDCEDPFHSSLWTRINKESEIYFVYTPTPPKPDLSIFPAPFYDDLHYGPVELQYLMPQQSGSSATTLRALATVNATLAQAAAWHPMQTSFINSLSEAKYPVIVVGTSSEQPAIGSLTGGKSINEPFIQITHSPSNPLIPVLVVTGGKSDDVLKAAKAIAKKDRSFLNGDSASLGAQNEGVASVSHDWRPNYIPDRDDFKLSDMGYKDQSVRGFFSSPIIMDFKAIPDFKYRERDQSVTIHFQYTGNLNTDLSTMEVKIDDIVVRAYPLTNRNGEQKRETFEMPSGLVHPNSKFRVQFHLFPIGWDPCKRVEDEQLNATLFADTEFHLPKDNVIKLPDLEAFRNGGFPFTEYQDMQNLAIVLPQNPSPNDIQMLMNVTTRLGRMTKSERISFEVYLGAINDETKRTKNLIVIGVPNKQPLIGQISDAKKSVFKISGDNSKQLVGVEGDPQLTSSVVANQGYIEEVVSPWNPTFTFFEEKKAKHVILVLTGRNEQAMMNAGKVLVDDRLFLGDRVNNKDLRGLEGNLVLVEDTGRFNVQRTPDVYRSTDVATVTVWRGIQLFISSYWVWFLLVVFIILLLAFIIFRAALVRYRNRHSSREPVRFTS